MEVCDTGENVFFFTFDVRIGEKSFTVISTVFLIKEKDNIKQENRAVD